MKYLRYAVLAVLLLAAMSLCGTVVLWIFGKLLNLSFDNLIYSGFKVGFVATVILGVSEYVKRRKAK